MSPALFYPDERAARNRHARAGVCCGAKMVDASLGDLDKFVAGELTGGPARPRPCQGRGATSCTAALSSAPSPSSSSYSSSVFDKQHCVWIAIVPISVFTVERRVGPRALPTSRPWRATSACIPRGLLPSDRMLVSSKFASLLGRFRALWNPQRSCLRCLVQGKLRRFAL